jgi:hypothetical protein
VRPAAAADCAFQDVNDNGVFDSGTDIAVPDASWIGTPFISNFPFVVPPGCDHILANAPGPLLGIRVIATKIVFQAKLKINKAGGRGIVFIADPSQVPAPVIGDGSIQIGPTSLAGPQAVIVSGGSDLFFPATVPAVFQRSISLFASGKCTITNADIEGFVPTGSTEIGINCHDDIVFRGSTVIGSRVNIQSIAGVIDARSFAPAAAGNLGDLCDDPVKNLQGGAGAPGNGDGLPNAGDFPCKLDFAALGPGIGVKTFPDQAALLAFCGASAIGGPNVFQAFNDPLIMIAQGNLDLRGVASPDGSGDTKLRGRYRVTLASVTGDVLAQFTEINHQPSGLGVTPPSGARIEIAAHPTTVNRLPDDREDFIGPASGTLNIDNACLQSVQKIVILNGMTVTGTPDTTPPTLAAPTPPCAQFPADFVFVPAIIH